MFVLISKVWIINEVIVQQPRVLCDTSPKLRPKMSIAGEDAGAGLIVGQDLKLMQQNFQ